MALEALDREAAAIDSEEKDAWDKWARLADGPPPSPQARKREALAQKRQQLVANDLASAQAGEKAVASRLNQLVSQLADIDDDLFVLRIWDRETSARRRHEAVCDAMMVGKREDLEFCADRGSLYDVQNRETRPKRVEAAKAAILRLEQLKVPELVGDPNELARLVAERRLQG